MFKNFFACKIVVAANQRYRGNIQRFFRLQPCLSRKSSISWKYSKNFSPTKLSQQQPINILKTFKNFFACKIVVAANHDILEIFKDFSGCKNVVAANHRYTGNIQRLFWLQICLSRKSSKSWKYSKIFSPATLSQPQIIDILEIFKDFFACKIVVAATHQYSENVQKLFRLQNCLSRNSRYPGNFQRLFWLQNCRSRHSSIQWKYSKTFSAANLSWPQIIDILEIFNDFFACKIVVAATHQYSENVQRLFRLQNCRSRKSAISWKHSNIFPPAKKSQRQPINILKMFKNFLAAKLSQPQISDILEIFKDFFGCNLVLAANHRYPGNIQRLFRLQNCRSSNPSIFQKRSKTFSPAKLSQPQISDILETVKDFSACKNVLAANHLYPGNIQ